MADDVTRMQVRLEAQLNAFDRQMKRAQGITSQAMTKMETRIQQSEGRVAGIMGRIGAKVGPVFATALGAAGIGAVIENVKSAAAELAKIGDVADRIGVTTEALQALRHASEQNAGSAEAVDSGLTRFAANMADASAKTGDLYKVLTANNVAFTDTQGKLLPTIELLQRYADLVKNARTPQEQLELAVRAFGRSAGPELATMLKEGGGGLQTLITQAKLSGAVLDDHVIRKAQELDDKFVGFARTLKTQVRGAIIELITKMREFSGAFANFLKAPAEATNVALQKTNDDIGKIKTKMDELKSTGAVAFIGDFEKQLAAAESRRDELSQLMRETNRGIGLGQLPAPGAGTAPATELPGSGDGEGGGAAGNAKAIVDGYQAIRREALARIETLRTEGQTLGLTAEQSATLRFEQDLLADAMRDGTPLTQAQREEIAQLAAEYGVVAGQTRAAKEAQEQFNETMEFTKDLSRDALKGFIGDLRDGVSAAEALGNALDRVADRMLDKTLDGLVDGLFKAGGSLLSGGNIGFGGGGFLTGGGVIPGRAAGGPVKAGHPYVVGERGAELFVPKTAGAIVPDVSRMTLPDMAVAPLRGGGGGPTTLHVHVDVTGARGNAEIEAIAYRATAAGMAEVMKRVPGHVQRTVLRDRGKGWR